MYLIAPFWPCFIFGESEIWFTNRDSFRTELGSIVNRVLNYMTCCQHTGRKRLALERFSSTEDEDKPEIFRLCYDAQIYLACDSMRGVRLFMKANAVWMQWLILVPGLLVLMSSFSHFLLLVFVQCALCQIGVGIAFPTHRSYWYLTREDRDAFC